GGGGAGLGRVGDDGPDGRVHGGEPARRSAQSAAAERVGAARVQDHHVEPAHRVVHLIQHHAGADQAEIEVLPLHRIGVHRYQPVGAVDLQAVAGVVEQ